MREQPVTVQELAANILRVHPQTVYSKATTDRPAPAGCIPGFRVGRAWRFFPSEVRAHLAEGTDPWARKR